MIVILNNEIFISIKNPIGVVYKNNEYINFILTNIWNVFPNKNYSVHFLITPSVSVDDEILR